MPRGTNQIARSWALSLATALGPAGLASGQNCAQTSVGFTPLSDLGAGQYLGMFEGGLYPGGSNQIPAAHHAAGLARAALVQPLDVNGDPDPGGRIGLLSVGMSNTMAEFAVFMDQADAHPMVEQNHLVLVPGARFNETAAAWDSPTDLNYDRVRDNILAVWGMTEAQVQVAWVKQANPQPMISLPDAGSDADVLHGQLGDIVRAMHVRYPNLQLVFFSSRIYAGYADVDLNPEPYAYETGLSVKWVIEAQIEQEATSVIDPVAGDLSLAGGAPWLGWASYLWADGTTPRSDGLIWECTDLMADGTHPSTPGRIKVAAELLDFFLASPYTVEWFRGVPLGDVDADGMVGVLDFLLVLSTWGPCDPCDEDVDRDGTVGVSDFLAVLTNWGP